MASENPCYFEEYLLMFSHCVLAGSWKGVTIPIGKEFMDSKNTNAI